MRRSILVDYGKENFLVKKFHLFLNAMVLICGMLIFIPATLADSIDFETVPGVTPVEGMEINTQFEQIYGVTFSLSNGNSPRLAEVGPPLAAFMGPPNHSIPDTPAPNQGIGQFFLTDDGQLGISADLVVTYTNPVKAASGVIIDIDLGEEWQIIAGDINGLEIDRIALSSGSPGTGDGIATIWSFEHQYADIYLLRFTGYRPDAQNFGLAFDNFSPSSPAVPICEGDFDNDGDVDGSDLAVFAADFGRTDCDEGETCEGDFDDDGDVDGSDIAVFAADFGRTDCPVVPNE